MQIEAVHRVFFVGIGGIGMSALARYFLHIGKEVAGYDRTPSALTDALLKEGAQVHFRDDVREIPEAYRDRKHTLVVYTPAVPADHKELSFFREGGFPVKKRAEVLGMISEVTRCMAVAGTHGKTTTSCILAHLLKESGMDVMALLGGISEDFGSNFLMAGTEFSVVEADEYDRSFLWLRPEVACVTSMDADHLDIYENKRELEASFMEFTRNLRPGGKLVVRNGLPIEGLTYGIEDDSLYSIRNLRTEQGGYTFDIRTPERTFHALRFNKPGHHNLLNGLAAFTMALQIGSQPERLIEALATFKGVERRFSYKLKTDATIFIDDYAHHPTEIEAVYQAIREMHPGRRILAVFQPHLYTRTRDFSQEFARSLARFDQIWLLDIYPAREIPIPGITSTWLLEQIENPEKRLLTKEELIPEIMRASPDILLTMGAGDIGRKVTPIQNALRYAS